MRLTERYLGSTYQCQGGFTLWFPDWCHLQPPKHQWFHNGQTPPPTPPKFIDEKKSHTQLNKINIKNHPPTFLAIHPFLRLLFLFFLGGGKKLEVCTSRSSGARSPAKPQVPRSVPPSPRVRWLVVGRTR